MDNNNNFSICHSGEYIGEAKKHCTDISLLASGDGTEIMKVRINVDRRLSFYAKEGFEALYVLKGELEWKNGHEQTELKAGGYISGQNMSSLIVFSTKTEVELLYISSQPIFDSLRDYTDQLMKLANAIEEKDGYTSGHCDRLQTLSTKTGEYLGLSLERLEALTYAAYLHDMGKAKIPEEILDKKGPLTDEEWEIIKTHPTIGKKMVENTAQKKVGIIVEQHHERIDGSGYPHGLKGNDISVEAQIVGIVDTFDAITTERPYRKAQSVEDAIAELISLKDVKFSGHIIDAFLTVLQKEKIKL